MLPLAVLSPFILMPLAAWLGKRSVPYARLLALWPAALAVYFGILLRSVAGSGPIGVSFPWAPALGLSLSFYADGLSLLFAILIAGIGSLIVIFGTRYFDGHEAAGRFQCILFAFMGSMLGVVLADNMLALFVFWELTGFTSYLLIGFDHEWKQARDSALQALLVTGMGGMALLAGALLVQQFSGTATLSTLLNRGAALQNASVYTPVVVLVLLAAFTKSAQAPFHFWLPNAMTAPTPVSAYLHCATMVKAGIYLVARMTPILGGTPLWTGLVTAAGAITMIIGAWRAIGETDLKRVLAYSTVGGLGVLMMLLGVGTRGAITAALVYLIAHACYKGALFLVAGTLEHETGTRTVTDLGGLRHSMPVTALAAGLAACSMAGVPLFLGFTGKELFYEALFVGAGSMQWLLAPAVAASAVLGAAGLIAGIAPFFGPPGNAVAAHRAPAALALPPLVLTLVGFGAGLWPGSIDTPLGLAVDGVLHQTGRVHLALWHGMGPVLMLSLLTLALAALLFVVRAAVRQTLWQPSAGFEWLYTAALRGLDAISAWAVPALQSASLRSYVLVVVVTAAVLIAGVIGFAGLPNWPAVLGVQSHELAAVLLIIAAACSAVRAKSIIAAVLSLGVVGYGAALTFLFFGAPDLAMTQFSVETLTAVIFVLVFYHFRGGVGPLSPWRVRARDALIAVLFGSSITIVLLFVGASVTPLRIAAYFAEMARPLAHGRNVVNVILVDFRALDTLGEITVLATAALGVRALLRLGRGHEKN